MRRLGLCFIVLSAWSYEYGKLYHSRWFCPGVIKHAAGRFDLQRKIDKAAADTVPILPGAELNKEEF